MGPTMDSSVTCVACLPSTPAGATLLRWGVRSFFNTALPAQPAFEAGGLRGSYKLVRSQYN